MRGRRRRCASSDRSDKKAEGIPEAFSFSTVSFSKKMQKRKREYIGFVRRKHCVILFVCVVVAGLYFGLPFILKTTYAPSFSVTVPALPAENALPVAVHAPTPRPVKAIYMTSCVAGTPSFRADLVKLIDETELNSVVIDIKDYSGTLSFVPQDEKLKEFVSPRCVAPDMREFIKSLHDKNIYIIGRITVFQDPVLTKRRPELAVKRRSDGAIWRDYKGLSFTDPGAQEVWEYHVAIAKEAYAIGFDELNFDYIRFPSDGPMQDIAFSWSGNREKSEVLEDFFAYLSRELKPLGIILSADLFGMTTTNTDDLNIGQILEKAEPYFDYISPMVYPSHYPPTFMGFGNPNKYPYEVVKYSMDEAVKRFVATTTEVEIRGVSPISTTTPNRSATGQAKPFLYSKKAAPISKLRPWLQDFDYGGNYDVAEVQAQMKAVYDAGLTSWMLWSPSNQYTKGALLPE